MTGTNIVALPKTGPASQRDVPAGPAATAEEETRIQARAERLLAERTLQLARRTRATTRQLTTLIMLRIEGERFAIRAADALEIVPMAAAASMPHAHPALLGIVDRRGVICHVHDLATLCGMRPAAARTAGHLVVLRAQHGQIGLRVDRAETLIEADLDELLSGDTSVQTKVGFYTKGGFTLLSCHMILEIVASFETD